MNPSPPRLQPALLGGLFIGVLSALPVISVGNCCCCLWVLGGGVLAVYLMQQNYPFAVTAADGALVGLMAGAIGGVVALLISLPLEMVMGPVQQRMLQRIASNPDFPEQYRTMVENILGSTSAAIGVRVMFGLVGTVVSAVFAMLGGLLGVAIFKKKDLPPPGTTEVLPPTV
jgi:hypothetical protein